MKRNLLYVHAHRTATSDMRAQHIVNLCARKVMPRSCLSLKMSHLPFASFPVLHPVFDFTLISVVYKASLRLQWRRQQKATALLLIAGECFQLRHIIVPAAARGRLHALSRQTRYACVPEKMPPRHGARTPLGLSAS
jgi:hypothetical protein